MNKDKWTYKTMGEVGSFLRGKSILKSDFVEKGMPCIHYGQVHTKFGISVDKHLSEIPNELYKKSIIASPGDTIIAITSEDLEGSCKSTDWMGNYDVAVSAHAAVYKHSFVAKFIPYYLRSHSFYVEKEKYARGFKVMEIKPSDLAKIPVPIPSKETQNFIVSELDAINDSITMLQQQVSDLDILAQSLFYDMFGDPITNPKGFPLKKICEVGTVITGNTPSTKDSENYSSNDYCFVKPSDIAKEGVADIQTSEFFISKKAYSNSRQLPKGSVLTTCIGIIGKVGILRKTATCNQQINAIVPNSDISSIYLAYTILGLRDVLKAMANAPVVPIINKGVFSMFQIPLPPLSLQHSFATMMACIEETKASLNFQITEMQNLLSSRMQYWFD
jgi:type I restriction enzyme S subunit